MHLFRQLYRETCASTSLVEVEVHDEADDIDDLSWEEETLLGFGRGNGRRKRLVFPKEELWAGYIWKAEAMFNVKVNNIHEIVNLETNHRMLTRDRMMDIYQRMREKDNDFISPSTLKPIMYIVESTWRVRERLRKEVAFTMENAVCEFEAVFLHYADAMHRDEVLGARPKWFETNIIREPVDR